MAYSYEQSRMKANAGKSAGKSVSLTAGLSERDKAVLLEIRENNVSTVQEHIEDAIVRALEAIGLVCEGHAKKLCPVDTGRLRNSITHVISPDEHAVYVGTNVSYAAAVELGTSSPKRDPQPYLYPAASDHGDQYRRILQNEMSG